VIASLAGGDRASHRVCDIRAVCHKACAFRDQGGDHRKRLTLSFKRTLSGGPRGPRSTVEEAVMAQRRPPYRALAITLTALVWLAAPAALAQSDRGDRTSAARAIERYYSSYGDPADRANAALAIERYLTSYGPPQTPANSTVVTPNVGPSWTATILAGALLAVTAAGLGVLAGRASVRPPHTTAQAGTR
jgi:hypothetical protein